MYTHDALGNLTEVILPNNDEISYIYDGRNRRIAKMINGAVTERFIYQNQLKPAAKVDANGNILEQYIYGTRINTPDYIIKNSEKYRVVSDERGSVRLVVKVSDGTVSQRIDYDEFGIVIADSNPGFQPFYYSGGVYDLDTQLVKFGARDYDPATGRWLQKEPLGFAGSDNFYSYCDGDPVNYVDVTGQDRLKYDRATNKLSWEDDDGNAYGDYDVVSGWRSVRDENQTNGPTPRATYTIDSISLVDKTHPKQESFCDSSGNCWWAPMTPTDLDFPDRSSIGLHPDGGVKGITNGCIGLTADDTSDLYNRLKYYLLFNLFIEVTVE